MKGSAVNPRGARPITLPPPLGEIEERRQPLKAVGVTILVLTAFGAFVLLMGGYRTLWEIGAESDWSWWHYALAVPVTGLLYFGLMAIGEALIMLIAFPLRWLRREYPTLMRVIFWCLIALIAIALLYLPYFFLTLNDV